MILRDSKQQLRIPKIDQLYEDILSQIKEDSAWWDLTARVLSWVTFSKRHLHPEELFSILGAGDNPVQLAFVDRVFSLSRGLLTSGPGLDALFPGHSSLKEYLQRNRTRWSLLSEADLTSECIRYLLGVVPEHCPTWRTRFAPTDSFPFYQYAAAFWGYHIRREDLGTSASDILTMDIFQNRKLCESCGQALLLSLHPDYCQPGAGVRGLHLAAIFGLVREVNLLLEDTDPDTSDWNGTTPLAYAVSFQNMDVAMIMLKNQADPNASDRWGRTPLHIAAYLGQESAISILLDHGANPEATYMAQDVDSEANAGVTWTPLLIAAVEGHESAVSLLLKRGADIHTTLNDGSSALMLAASEGHLPVVQELLKNGADVEQKDNAGYSVLKRAIQSEQNDVVSALLDGNADTAQSAPDGYTPLLLAVKQCNLGIASLLIDSGADIEKSINGWTALHLAAREEYEDMVGLLLESGAHVDSKLDAGWTPLMIGIDQANDSIVTQLLDGGARADSRLSDGATPLIIAAGNRRNDSITEILLSRGADPNATDDDGDTALLTWIDCSTERDAGIAVLVEYGADLEAPGKDGLTPLLFAVKAGKEASVRELLDHGASLDAVGPNGETALGLAAENDSGRIHAILSETLSVTRNIKVTKDDEETSSVGSPATSMEASGSETSHRK